MTSSSADTNIGGRMRKRRIDEVEGRVESRQQKRARDSDYFESDAAVATYHRMPRNHQLWHEDPLAEMTCTKNIDHRTLAKVTTTSSGVHPSQGINNIYHNIYYDDNHFGAAVDQNDQSTGDIETTASYETSVATESPSSDKLCGASQEVYPSTSFVIPQTPANGPCTFSD